MTTTDSPSVSTRAQSALLNQREAPLAGRAAREPALAGRVAREPALAGRAAREPALAGRVAREPALAGRVARERSERRIETKPQDAIDPRGPQFGAAITVAVLGAVLLLPTPWATGLLALQAVLFALGAGLGVQATPTAWLFRHLVRPRLAPTTEWEAPQPPRFAQAVGLGFAVVGLVGFLAGATLVAQVAVGAAFAAALLNAAFRFCLGCEVYLLARRYAFN